MIETELVLKDMWISEPMDSENLHLLACSSDRE
jgi:hypothetical protein